MTVFVGLLYSIVLPKGRLIMADLKDLAASLDLKNPRTLLATGNLIFEADASVSELETRLEKAFAARFGKHVDFIVRSAADWRKLVNANPFGEGDPERVMVRVQRDPLPDSTLEMLERYRPEGDKIRLVSGDLWVKFAGKPSDSRLLSALTTQKLGVGTSRIWNTVRKIGDASA